MNRKVIAATIAAAAVSLSAWSLAAERDKPAAQGMMSGCPMMGNGMGSHMQGGGMMPQLPRGNEKLQLQMWGEMMQKMGEIEA